MRDRIEFVALGAAALVVAAFLFSFLMGLGGQRAEVPPAPAPIRTVADPPVTPASAIKVEVLNGSGRRGLARAITDRLREAGFDVVITANASRAADSTVVIDRAGRQEGARAVAERLGIENVRSQPDSTLLLDVTVILGKDWPAPDSSRDAR